MKYIFLFIFPLLLLFSCPTWAGEYNIGLHVNPVFSTPILEKSSEYEGGINVGNFMLCYNVGANFNITNKKVAFETGINIIQKKFRMGNRVKTYSAGYNSFALTAYSTSFEFPMLVAANIHKHDRNDIVYDLYLLGGLSYEIFVADGHAYSFSTVNEGQYYIYDETYDIPHPGAQNNWLNFVAGFKINAVIRHFGLIDYGLSFHLPGAVNFPYRIESVVRNQDTGEEVLYKANLKPRMAYIDVKFCYYFLNLDNNGRRIKYKSGEYY